MTSIEDMGRALGHTSERHIVQVRILSTSNNSLPVGCIPLSRGVLMLLVSSEERRARAVGSAERPVGWPTSNTPRIADTRSMGPKGLIDPA